MRETLADMIHRMGKEPVDSWDTGDLVKLWRFAYFCERTHEEIVREWDASTEQKAA